MTIGTFRSSRAPECVLPRQPADISTRGKIHGLAEERAGWFDWTLRAAMIGGTAAVVAFSMGWLS